MISVLIATRNRAAILRRVLTSYLELEAPDGGWQLVVVDNGSTDETPRVLEEFAGRLPLVSVREPRAGKNAALNAGLQHVRGDLILFTDDDILPPRDWLLQYRRAAEENPGYAMFGGPIEAAWPRTPPSWMTADGYVTRTCFALSDPRQNTGSGLLQGGNLAIRAELFTAHGYRYNTEIGPDGTVHFAMGSEAELQHRLLRDGHKRFWVAGARVLHIIREEQMSRRYMLGRAVRFGRGCYRQEYYLKGHPKRLFGVPRWTLRPLLGYAARTLLDLLRGRLDGAFVNRWYCALYWGQMAEGWRLRSSSEARKQPAFSGNRKA